MIKFKMKPNCVIDELNGNDSTGQFLCSVYDPRMDRGWAVVLIDGEKEPTLVPENWIDVK